jgi:hypothetical protein
MGHDRTVCRACRSPSRAALSLPATARTKQRAVGLSSNLPASAIHSATPHTIWAMSCSLMCPPEVSVIPMRAPSKTVSCQSRRFRTTVVSSS